MQRDREKRREKERSLSDSLLKDAMKQIQKKTQKTARMRGSGLARQNTRFTDSQRKLLYQERRRTITKLSAVHENYSLQDCDRPRKTCHEQMKMLCFSCIPTIK